MLLSTLNKREARSAALKRKRDQWEESRDLATVGGIAGSHSTLGSPGTGGDKDSAAAYLQHTYHRNWYNTKVCCSTPPLKKSMRKEDICFWGLPGNLNTDELTASWTIILGYDYVMAS